jgi:polyisoprenoid-binding protein YceI
MKVRHPRRWLLIGAAVVVLLVVGGPFLYFNVIEGKAPARLSLSSKSGKGSPSTTTGASVPLDGPWKVASGSQAGYRVKEILFGQNHEAVGRTSNVTGQITVSGSTVNATTFTVDLTTVASDEGRRDRAFQGRIMDTASFPTATFTLSQPIELGSVPASGAQRTVQARGQLTLRGTTKPVGVQLTTRYSGSLIEVSGSIPVKFAEWNIPNPSFGPANTEDNGVIEFLLHFSHA